MTEHRIERYAEELGARREVQQGELVLEHADVRAKRE